MKPVSMTFTGGFVLLPLMVAAGAFLLGHHLGVKQGIETPRTRATQRYDWQATTKVSAWPPQRVYLQTNVVTTTNVSIIVE